MTQILLPDDRQRPLSFYLSLEEWVARTLPAEDSFFLWQVPPTVIFGRNQDIEAEVNLGWCREHGVNVVRRKSGGGCVYADEGNVMVSYVTSATDVIFVFETFLSYMTLALNNLGLEAERTGHNDIVIRGHKVSGNACYSLPSSSIVHGTLMYEVDIDAMQQAITPSQEKLSSHGVQSVRQRVANLCELGLFMSCEQFKTYLKKFFCNSSYVLSADEVAQVEEIEKSYTDPTFITTGKYINGTTE